MGRSDWYRRRLLAMTPTEVFAHIRKAVFRARDSSESLEFPSINEPRAGAYPFLLERPCFSSEYRQSIVSEADDLLAGKWILFREISLQVDTPPKWHKDYLSDEEIFETRPFGSLNHRNLNNADIKVIWDLNRWTQLVRIAQAEYLTEKGHYGDTVTRWLEDWIEVNPPFRGWNWTSSLESAIRLIQFAWIEALLENRIQPDLRDAIVTPHLHYTWRHRSFGSSANNHWLGELAGLIVANTRWGIPMRRVPNIEILKERFETEILRQFSEDGGNKEQAFHYHLFAFEFIIHVYYALQNSGLEIRPDVVDRIRAAASFIVNLQSPDLRWDYGDSDDAVLVPLGENIPTSLHRWKNWLEGQAEPNGLSSWLGSSPFSIHTKKQGWYLAEHSGYAAFSDDDWFVRLDGSPLGYLSIAAHGHLDALHVSVWYRSKALIVDPGTGAYFFDPDIRQKLADQAAHNGPFDPFSRDASRRGVFMWSDHHPRPSLWLGSNADASAQFDHRGISRRRSMGLTEGGWTIEDEVRSARATEIATTWIFAPDVKVEQMDSQTFKLMSGEAVLWFGVDSSWERVRLGPPSMVSPSFRVLDSGPAIFLVGESNRPRPYVTFVGRKK
jgi:hypothetical protein